MQKAKKTPEAANVFSHHKDDEFYEEFSKLVKKSYHALFDLHGDDSWSLGVDDLITFFRMSDQTSDAIGRRQANTFKVFAALSGHGELPSAKSPSTSKKVAPKKKVATKKKLKIKNQTKVVKSP